MRHTPSDSLEEMLSVEAMSALERRAVTCVNVRSWTPELARPASGCEFRKVESVGSGGSRHYVVKRPAFDTDLVRQLTEDIECRERLLWQHGIFDRLPPEVRCPTAACARDGLGWALLMDDVHDWLTRSTSWPAPGWQPLSLAQFSVVINALASLHARFYCDSSLYDPALGLCTSAQFFTAFSPEAVSRTSGDPHGVLRNIQRGWELLDTLDAPDVASAIRELHRDPTPLVNALARFPATVVHGDPKRANVGFRGGRMVLIDWQLASVQPPAVDLAWLLQSFALVVTESKETILAEYRRQLATRLGERFDDANWQAQVQLAFLGQCLRTMGMWLSEAHYAPTATARDMRGAQIPWWCDQARAGLRLL